MAALAAGVNYPTERISTVVLFGPVYQKVLAEAEEWGAEVVVVGSHRTGMDRFLIGSNAGAISTPRKVLSACRAVFASTAP
ncbi:universal stress protein [Methylocystis rosea]|uniref:universal stress protein n=1 Tax=Methylocystis TaxID=133 RepID=UPI003158982A